MRDPNACSALRIAFLASLLVSSLSHTPADAQIPLSTGPDASDVTQHEVSSTGYAVYLHDVTEGSTELWSVPVSGGTPVKLNGPLGTQNSVAYFTISPDGQFVYYGAAEAYAGYNDVYRVPITGGARLKLSPDHGDPLDPGSIASGYPIGVTSIEISPSGDHLAVTYGTFFDDFWHFFVPTDGSSAGFSSRLETFEFSPNGDFVALAFDPSVLTSAPQIRSLADGSSLYFRGLDEEVLGFSSNDDWALVYESGQLHRIDLRNDVSSVASLATHSHLFPAARITDDGDVIYIGRNVPPSSSFRLFNSRADGTLTTLAASLATGHDVVSFQLSPDETRVVFRADLNTDDTFELYSVPATGAIPAPISQALPMTHDADVRDDYVVTNDHVVFFADVAADEFFELFSAPLNGTGPVIQLSADFPETSEILDPRVSPDEQALVYSVALEGAFPSITVWQGFHAPLAGPRSLDPIWSNPSLLSYEDFKVDWSRDRVVVWGGGIGNPKPTFWLVSFSPIDDFGDLLLSTFTFPAGGNVKSFLMAPDGTVVFLADSVKESKDELFSVGLPLFSDGFESGDASRW